VSLQSKKFQLSACGGTFDLFHKGHENFLHAIFKGSENVVIGITSDKFVESKKTFESFSKRKKSVQNFLDKFSYGGEIIQINDIFGPTLDKKFNFEAIFVTSDSLPGAKVINEKRKALGLYELEIVEVALEKSSDGKIVSSHRIKNGEIDRKGEVFIDGEILNRDFILPYDLREELSKPFGKLIEDFPQYLKKENFDRRTFISIGDVTTSVFLKNKIVPKLSIIDFKVNRIKRFDSVFDLGFKNQETIEINNPAGRITADLILKVKRFFNEKGKDLVIKINGEEDLAVIPVVLASPLGYEIYYGQPGRGVVRILVTENKKAEIKSLISKFSQKVL